MGKPLDGGRLYTRSQRKVKIYNKLDALKILAEYLGVTESMAPKVTVYLKTGINRKLPEPRRQSPSRPSQSDDPMRLGPYMDPIR